MDMLVVFVILIGAIGISALMKRRQRLKNIKTDKVLVQKDDHVAPNGSLPIISPNNSSPNLDILRDSPDIPLSMPSLQHQVSMPALEHQVSMPNPDDLPERSLSPRHSEVRPVIEARKGKSAPPDFPFLKISNIVKNGMPTSFRPNTREPCKFDGDACSGEMLVMLRTNPIDPEFIWAFDKKRRQFEMQVRIKFKVQPRGVVYLGGEIPKRMSLGLATDLACKGILAVIRRISSACHASFGDEAGEELPHIVFPLWHAADRLVITKPGEALPAIGKGQIAESDTARSARLKDSTLGRTSIAKGDTVTFSFHSAYMDFVEWKLRGLGAIRDQSLSWFWGSLPLHVVVYDVGADSKKHLTSGIRYYLRFEVKNTWNERGKEDEGVLFHTNDDEDDLVEDEEEDDDDEEEPSEDEVAPPASSEMPSSMPSTVVDFASAPAVGRRHRFRAPRIFLSMLGRSSNSSASTKKIVSPPQSPRASGLAESSFNNVQAGGQLHPLFAVSLANQQHQTRIHSIQVPMWIRLRRPGGPDAVRFVVLCERGSEPNLMIICDSERLCKLLPAASWRVKSLFSLMPNKKKQQQTRLNSALARLCEHRRRVFDEEGVRMKPSVVDALEWKDSPLGDVLQTDIMPPVVASKKFVGPDVGKVLYSTLILRQVFETQWQEEWLVLLRANHSKSVFCLFFLNKKTPIRIIPAASILSILSADDAKSCKLPLADAFPALTLETLSKIKLLCFPSLESRAKVLEILSAETSQRPFGEWNNDANSDASSKSANLPESIPSAFSFALDTNAVVLEETFRWGQKKRIILNMRKSVFSMTCSDSIQDDPVGFLQQLLHRAFGLITSASPLNQSDQIAFFNECSRLKGFDLIEWGTRSDENSRKAFFLNLYHVILIHARHMVGPFSSSASYQAFASQMSYEFGSTTRGHACVLSLGEIEHRILRPFASSSPASSLMEPVPVATEATNALALRQVDPRISLALNRMCISCDFRLSVFSVEHVDAQLDRVASSFLSSFLEVEAARKRVKVPRILEWYWIEFDMEEPSPRLAVGAVLRWMPTDKLYLLSSLVGDTQSQVGSMPHVGSMSDLMEDPAAASTNSVGQVKFEFRKYHWQPRTTFELLN